MKKKIVIWSACVLGCFFAVIGVPLLINEAYKVNSGYITLWGAPEVLSYYGTILGSAVAVATLVATIVFTRKQIYRENYLKAETERWEKIESLVLQALNIIHPIQIVIKSFDIDPSMPEKASHMFRMYQLSCTCALDDLLAYLGKNERLKLQKILDNFRDLSNELCDIASELVDAYDCLRDVNMQDSARTALKFSQDHPGKIAEQDVELWETLLKDTEGKHEKDIHKKIQQANDKMIKKGKIDYSKLLQLKTKTFDEIYREVQQQSDEFLYIGRNK